MAARVVDKATPVSGPLSRFMPRMSSSFLMKIIKTIQHICSTQKFQPEKRTRLFVEHPIFLGIAPSHARVLKNIFSASLLHVGLDQKLRMKVKYVNFVGEAVNSGMDQYNDKIDMA